MSGHVTPICHVLPSTYFVSQPVEGAGTLDVPYSNSQCRMRPRTVCLAAPLMHLAAIGLLISGIVQVGFPLYRAQAAGAAAAGVLLSWHARVCRACGLNGSTAHAGAVAVPGPFQLRRRRGRVL